MTKRERLELLIMKLAVMSGNGDQFWNVVKCFKEELTPKSLEEMDMNDLNDIKSSEMIQGFAGVWEFNDDPSANTIILTARTMVEFHLNDLIKMEGINIF